MCCPGATAATSRNGSPASRSATEAAVDFRHSRYRSVCSGTVGARPHSLQKPATTGVLRSLPRACRGDSRFSRKLMAETRRARDGETSQKKLKLLPYYLLRSACALWPLTPGVQATLCLPPNSSAVPRPPRGNNRPWHSDRYTALAAAACNTVS